MACNVNTTGLIGLNLSAMGVHWDEQGEQIPTMTQRSFPSLRKVRTELLGYSFHSVVRLAKIDAERLRAIEEENLSPTVYELESLAKVYGIESDRLFDEPILLQPGDAVAGLTYSEEFTDLGDLVRVRIVWAASAARDLLRLRVLDGQPLTAPDQLVGVEFADKHLLPFRQGAALADRLREELGLGDSPIPSLRDLVRDEFPWITVLHSYLTSQGPAGITFADVLRSPTIVLNLDGKNRNPGVRRFSLAHELLHLLVDWDRAEPLAVLSGFFTESALEREQRANAFAIRFLCPESVLRGFGPDEPLGAARKLLSEYGLHYHAVRLYLRNEARIELPPTPPPELGALGTEAWLERAEVPEGLGGFPLGDVPPERRTVVARTAARCYSSGKISRNTFAEMLDVTPAHDLESVLDFFAIPQPE
jgi:Zn-dependent peptidase ImmA (M78 family)